LIIVGAPLAMRLTANAEERTKRRDAADAARPCPRGDSTKTIPNLRAIAEPASHAAVDVRPVHLPQLSSNLRIDLLDQLVNASGKWLPPPSRR
jgi:hypothetical protein